MSAIVAGASSLIQSPFGGFAPFPNSIMIPFMATQSAVLGYNFGIGYEMGKRTIKSLDNDFFNKIRAGSTDKISIVTDGKEIKMQYNEYISFITKRHGHEQIAIFESMIPNFMRLQDTIIDQSVEIEVKKANRTPSAMVEIVKAFGGSTAKEVVTQLDTFPSAEKAFILGASPLLAMLYIFGLGKAPFVNTGPKEPEPPLPGFNLEHKEVIGHEQHPFHSQQEPKQTTPDLNKPPEPKQIIHTLKFQARHRWKNANKFFSYVVKRSHDGHVGALKFHRAQLNAIPPILFGEQLPKKIAYILAYSNAIKTIHGHWH